MSLQDWAFSMCIAWPWDILFQRLIYHIFNWKYVMTAEFEFSMSFV